MKLEEWRSQIKRGTLEYCILLLVQQKPRYGYEIMSELEKRPVIAAKESTIYPLLAFWQETQAGLPPRKYYTLTERGAAYLEAVSREWENLVETVADLQEGSGAEREHAL